MVSLAEGRVQQPAVHLTCDRRAPLEVFDKSSTMADETHVLLRSDQKVKVAGIDCDGVLRGKIMSKEKFLSSIEYGFGMSSAIFGWDMHDEIYSTETTLARTGEGYRDLIAQVDLSSFRRLPFEDNIPFFLLKFSIDGKPVFADGRNIIESTSRLLAQAGMRAQAGVELEFMNFQTPSQDGYGSRNGHPNLASFLQKNSPDDLRPLTSGMFGYSVSRPVISKQYFHDIYDLSLVMGCPLESWHTESGPGVYEGAGTCGLSNGKDGRQRLSIQPDRFLTKSLGVEHGVTPCFMAKPFHGLPGNSGHIHVSLVDDEGNNKFARADVDDNAPWPDVAHLSDIGRHFLAGLIDALPDIMPLLAPNINSYKRLVENFWAPVTVSWGLEDRLSSIRLVAPPVCKPSATRFEVRIPGADMHPHYALAAIFSAGLRGIERKMSLDLPPNARRPAGEKAALLPNTLSKALERFEAQSSVAREIMGDDFVDFFAISRQHELKVWREAVTEWEFKRYIEQV